MSLPLSVLDLIPLASDATSSQALRNSLELAELADRLGYRRHWFAEHHNMPTVASTTPEVMIALAAERTTRLHVGAGGVMLPNHAPLKVAETYKMLEALYPGRIDLGIGRAPGTDPGAAIALRGSRHALEGDDFQARLAELLALGQGPVTSHHPHFPVAAMPENAPLPPFWLLGSSGYSADLAAMLGTGYAFAAHFSDFPPELPMLSYREQFQPIGRLERPHALLTVSVVCAETDAEAERLAASMMVSFVRLRTGQKALLLSPDEALAYPYTQAEELMAEAIRDLHLVGSPATVKARLDDMVTRTAADEVMVTTMTYGHADRMRSYELLAGAYALAPAR